MDPMYYLYTTRHKSTSPLSPVSPSSASSWTPSLAPSRSSRKSRKERIPPFEPETIDTFCFHWSTLHAYVLVRVLDHTLALLPVRSRLATKYHRHIQPNVTLRRRSRRESRSTSPTIQEWTTTLAVDVDRDKNTSQSASKEVAQITLADVLASANVQDGWIHAACSVKDLTPHTNAICIQSKNTTFELTARCFAEKMMFINLVKLKHSGKQDSEEQGEVDTIVATDPILPDVLIDYWQRRMVRKLDEVVTVADRLALLEGDIANYTNELDTLEEDLRSLSDALDNANREQHSLRRLSGVQELIQNTNTSYSTYRNHVATLVERVSAHSDFLTSASRQLQSARMSLFQQWGISYYLFAATAVIILLCAVFIGSFHK